MNAANRAKVVFYLSLFFTAQAFAQDVKVVVADGIGSDPQGAAQNAAQNALTQVVGSFIDTDTQLKRRTAIQNGIRSETKQIDKSIREYSQGTIQSFDILESRQEGALFKVTAKVGVRLAEFKAFAARLADGETEVSGGLFARMETDRKNTDSLASILSEKLVASLNGTVVEFLVGEPLPFRDFRGSALRSNNGNFDYQEWAGRFSADRLVVIPLTTKLRSDFIEHLALTFEKITVKKRRGRLNPNSRYSYEASEEYNHLCNADNDRLCWVIRDSASSVTAYQFKNVGAEMAANPPSFFSRSQDLRFWYYPFLSVGANGPNYFYKDLPMPDLNVSVLAKDGSELQVAFLRHDRFSGGVNSMGNSAIYADPLVSKLANRAEG